MKKFYLVFNNTKNTYISNIAENLGISSPSEMFAKHKYMCSIIYTHAHLVNVGNLLTLN